MRSTPKRHDSRKTTKAHPLIDGGHDGHRIPADLGQALCTTDDRCRSGKHRAVAKGISFDIADHVLANSWATFHGLQLTVRLDHGTKDEEFEEVIEFAATGAGTLSRWIMWRDATTVFIQPILGKSRQADSVSEALDNFFSKRQPVLTNIVSAPWPVD